MGSSGPLPGPTLQPGLCSISGHLNCRLMDVMYDRGRGDVAVEGRHDRGGSAERGAITPRTRGSANASVIVGLTENHRVRNGRSPGHTKRSWSAASLSLCTDGKSCLYALNQIRSVKQQMCKHYRAHRSAMTRRVCISVSEHGFTTRVTSTPEPK